jgi:hypothetical protein
MARIAALFLLVIFAAFPAVAQVFCASHDAIADLLGKRYAEAPEAWGFTAEGNLIEVFTSRSGSWTLVVTTPAGTSCPQAAGRSWTQARIEVGKRAPAM